MLRGLPPVDQNDESRFQRYLRHLSPLTQGVALAGMSNAFGVLGTHAGSWTQNNSVKPAWTHRRGRPTEWKVSRPAGQRGGPGLQVG